METAEIIAKIREADMVLAGLGEEFDLGGELGRHPEYVRGRELLRENGGHWLEPAWREYCSERFDAEGAAPALEKLSDLVEGKNYFIVATATSRQIARMERAQDRVVMPCGTTLKKQCAKGEGHGLEDVGNGDENSLKEFFDRLITGDFLPTAMPKLGNCSVCGEQMILNTVYAEHYDEQGYIGQWQRYTKWLQGTLNRRLVVLELGVSMRCPTVIRWPFEKIAYFNNKAFFIRVNETLYQLTEELGGKGCGIERNAVEWLKNLC